MKKYNLLLNLQRFAEDSGSDGAGDGGQGNGSQGQGDNGAGVDPNGGVGSDGKPATPPAGQITFASQAELDEVINKRVTEAVEKAHQNQQQQKDYDKMTDSEKLQFNLDKAQKDLAEANLKNTKMANRNKITARLGEDKLPVSLVDLFDDVLAGEEVELNKRYDATAKVFREAVQSEIDIRLANSADTPPAGGQQGQHLTQGASAAQSRNKMGKTGNTSLWDTK